MNRPWQTLHEGLRTTSPAETERAAADLAPHLPVDCVLALHGDLGAGKTTFVKGLAQAWSIETTVTSPTFNLYVIHRGLRQLVHLDAYRLHDTSDLDSLMLVDFLRSPYCLAVEWPERIADALPEETIHLYLTPMAQGIHRIGTTPPSG